MLTAQDATNGIEPLGAQGCGLKPLAKGNYARVLVKEARTMSI
jgi:hypothetical protein